MTLQKCTKCAVEKPLLEFHKEARAANGYRTACKQCDQARRVKRMTGMTVEKCAEHKAERRAAYQKIKPTAQAYSAQYRQRKRAKNLIYLAKARSRKLGVAFDLDQHESELQARIDLGVCELSGIPLDLTGTRGYASPSLDRIIPSKGYAYTNIRVLCQAMNCALGNWGEDRLLEVMTAWMGKK